MDQRVLVQRTQECFGGRYEDLLSQVRQDRETLRGWEEPAHLRAGLRQIIREGGPAAEAATAMAAMPENNLTRCAGEPEPGQQREALGQLLEHGAAAVERIQSGSQPDLTPEETLGLTCVLLLYGRPALLLSMGRLGVAPTFWSGMLEDQREAVEMNQRSIGRIELMGHPEYDWAGTGFLVKDTCLMTTRRVAEVFIERSGQGQWQFRPGVTAWMDFQSDSRYPHSAACRIQHIVGVHERYDLAMFEVENTRSGSEPPLPLMLAQQPPANLQGRPVYMVGYPVRDSRRSEPEPIARIFRDVYNTKRAQLGTARGLLTFNEVQLLQHDCGMLGSCQGAPILDLETQQVLGMQVSGRYMDRNVAVPLWVLQDDPLFRQCGITFARNTTPEEVDEVKRQIERLAQSRSWSELQAVVTEMYRRTFGNGHR